MSATPREWTEERTRLEAERARLEAEILELRGRLEGVERRPGGGARGRPSASSFWLGLFTGLVLVAILGVWFLTTVSFHWMGGG
jgi:hypothetical protein